MQGQDGSVGPPLDAPGIDTSLLRELVAYLREHRPELREAWVERITEAQLLRVMSSEEIFSEMTAVYDNYVDALETGSVETLHAYARSLSERIIRRGVETHEVLGIVLLLRDVLARSLFIHHQDDTQLDRVLDAYEPAANRIAVTVGVSFVEERERIIREQQAAIRELSTPVLQVRGRLLILPIIGVLDSQRARQLTEQLLSAIQANRAKVVVIDITGVATIDVTVANHLVQTVEASRLMGASAILTGPLVGHRADARRSRRRPRHDADRRRPAGRARGGRAPARLRGDPRAASRCRHRSREAGRMPVPILKQGNYLIASIQSALSDSEVLELRDDLADGSAGSAHAGSSSTWPRWTSSTRSSPARCATSPGPRACAAPRRSSSASSPTSRWRWCSSASNLEPLQTALDLEEALELLDAPRGGASRWRMRSASPIAVGRRHRAARGEGRALAGRLGFSRTDATLIATAISEVARNILVHAGSGEVELAEDDGRPPGAIVVVARDAGPASPTSRARCATGYATGNGLGLGLPGSRRLMDEFVIDTEGRRGHHGHDAQVARPRPARDPAPVRRRRCLSSRVWSSGPSPAVRSRASRAPATGGSSLTAGREALVAAVDGVGHGHAAAQAADVAAGALREGR